MHQRGIFDTKEEAEAYIKKMQIKATVVEEVVTQYRVVIDSKIATVRDTASFVDQKKIIKS